MMASVGTECFYFSNMRPSHQVSIAIWRAFVVTAECGDYEEGRGGVPG